MPEETPKDNHPDAPLVSVPISLLADLFALAGENRALREQIGDLQREVPFLRQEIRGDRDLRTLTGSSPAMKTVRQAINQVAPIDSTVLIAGETGTGKELVARAIHQLSSRRDHLLVTVNCAALNPHIIASELFGHEPGAFTGAIKRRPGRFEIAQHGTIFLDEIGEIPLDIQVLLLRVLQERTIERVGGNEPIDVNVRVIAASHQDLESAVRQGRFRADLFFRLNVFPIRMPPLRDRPEDIPDLIQHFIHFFNRKMNKHVRSLAPQLLRLLLGYHWPGNVRELENLVERAMIVAQEDTLAIEANWLLSPSPPESPRDKASTLPDLERQTILSALERSGGRIYGPTGAAAVLGLKPTTLYGKMRKHGIHRPLSRNNQQ